MAATSAATSPLGALANAATNIYGYQNAGEQQQQGIDAGIGAEQGAMGTAQNAYSSALGNVNNYYGTALSADQNYWNPSLTTGNAAINTLGSVLGTTGSGGSTPNYSAFYDMPGYQFAVNQGTQAIQRQASAMGSAYTPNTMDAVGQYVTGTAMQDYNTYINQLLNTAGLGQNAAGALTGAQTAAATGESGAQMAGAQGLTGAALNTAGNIANLDVGSGTAGANQQTGIAGSLANSNALGTILSSLFGGGTNTSTSGTSPSVLSSLGSAISSGASDVGNFLSSLFGSGSSNDSSGVQGLSALGSLGSNSSGSSYLTSPSASAYDTSALLNDMTNQAGLGALSSGNF